MSLSAGEDFRGGVGSADIEQFRDRDFALAFFGDLFEESHFGQENRGEGVYYRRVSANLTLRRLHLLPTSSDMRADSPALAYSRAADKLGAVWVEGPPPQDQYDHDVFARRLW